MHQLLKKSKRLNPVIEERQAKFDAEQDRLNIIRQKRIAAVTNMRAKQQEYMSGVARLNNERGTNNRLMLEALEIGLDNVKAQWMSLYQLVMDLEKEEKKQLEIMSMAHRELEAIKSLQNKYKTEHAKEMDRQDQKIMDEHSLRLFSKELSNRESKT